MGLKVRLHENIYSDKSFGNRTSWTLGNPTLTVPTPIWVGKQCIGINSVSSPAIVCLFCPLPPFITQNYPGHRVISSQSTALIRHSRTQLWGNKSAGNEAISAGLWQFWSIRTLNPVGLLSVVNTGRLWAGTHAGHLKWNSNQKSAVQINISCRGIWIFEPNFPSLHPA